MITSSSCCYSFRLDYHRATILNHRESILSAIFTNFSSKDIFFLKISFPPPTLWYFARQKDSSGVELFSEKIIEFWITNKAVVDRFDLIGLPSKKKLKKTRQYLVDEEGEVDMNVKPDFEEGPKFLCGLAPKFLLLNLKTKLRKFPKSFRSIVAWKTLESAFHCKWWLTYLLTYILHTNF